MAAATLSRMPRSASVSSTTDVTFACTDIGSRSSRRRAEPSGSGRTSPAIGYSDPSADRPCLWASVSNQQVAGDPANIATRQNASAPSAYRAIARASALCRRIRVICRNINRSAGYPAPLSRTPACGRGGAGPARSGRLQALAGLGGGLDPVPGVEHRVEPLLAPGCRSGRRSAGCRDGRMRRSGPVQPLLSQSERSKQ